MKARLGVLIALFTDASEYLLDHEATGIVLLAISWLLVGLVIAIQVAR